MRGPLAALTTVFALTGCVDLDVMSRFDRAAPEEAGATLSDVAVQVPNSTTPRPARRPVAGETSEETGGRTLGTSVVGLGNPAQPGLWLETPLVTAEAAGRVSLPSGAAVNVTLRPVSGGGARASLQTLQALGLSLASLTEVTIALR